MKVGTNSFTLSFWIKNTGIVEGDPVIVGNKDWESGDNEGFALFWKPESNEISLNIGNGNKSDRVDCSYTGMDQINTNDWIHIIAVVDRANAKASLYINFNKVAESSLEQFGDDYSFDWGDHCINIGQDGTGEYASLNAIIDEFIYFNGALTAVEVAELADYYRDEECDHKYENLACTVCGDKVVDKEIGAYLPFDDNTVDDISGNNVTTTGNGNLSYTDGKHGAGVDLSKGYVSTDLKVGTNSFTLSFWIKNTGIVEGDPVIVGNKDWESGDNEGFALFWKPESNEISLNIGNGNKSDRVDCSYTGMDQINTNDWIHIIAVVDRANAKASLYINFNKVAESSLEQFGDDYSFDWGDHCINIGQDGTGEYASLNAIIDEFIYFNGALTAVDVAKLADYYRKDYSEDYGEVLEVMSFNVYYNNNNKQSVIDQITAYMPDSFGVQEATPEWMDELNESLSSKYESVGEGRGSNTNSSNEYNAIFYNKDKFNCLGSGTKWLSSTPDECSFTEDGLTHYRIVTWAILERKSDGKIFIHANTHLDDSTPEVRKKQAEYLLAILAELSESNPNVPIILTGDFNTDWTKQDVEENKALFDLIANAGYVNAASNALDGDNADHITYHDYGESESETIDFAFVSEDDFTVLYYNVCNETTPAPSDHYALYFEFAFNDK